MIEWVEPFDSKARYPLICRMKEEDIIAYQRAREPRYSSDEEALGDFMIVHWAYKVKEEE